MRRTAVGSLLATLLMAIAAPPGGATPEPAVAVAELPLAFEVVNKNDSRVPCAPDGKTYRVVGDLVAPRALLETGRLRSVTVYQHGSGNGSFWHFGALPGYDYARAQTEAGHASVILDALGWGRSDWPNGNDVCFGSEADVIHQVIAQLRSGAYAAGSREPVAFERVALAGHSGGGLAVEIEAYSFDDIDALIVAGYTDNGVDPVNASFFYTDAAAAGQICALGGEQKTKPEGPSGYAYVFGGGESDKLFLDATNEVKAAFAAAYERDACGVISSAGQAIAANNALVPTVDVPVLVIAGDHDLFLSPRSHAERFTGSHDVSLAILPNAGHMLTLERTREDFRHTMSAWLAARGL